MDKMLFSENMKLADLISANHNLILMLPRFGIPLGFGERSVARVCAAYDVPVDFFLLVCNVYTFDAYLPNRETLQSIDMRLLVPYLHASHQYYLRHLPYLGRLLDGMASKVDKRYGNMLRYFFAGYKNEVEEHFDYEEQVVFPYIERLRIASENGETLPESYHIHDYAEAHDNIEDKLNDLTQIIFKYLPGNVSPEDSIDVVPITGRLKQACADRRSYPRPVCRNAGGKTCMSRKKKVLIVEPSIIIKEGLIKILGKSPELDVLRPSDGTEDYAERISVARPDILLINPTVMPYSKRYPVYSLAQEYPHMTIIALVYQYIDNAILHAFHSVLEIRESAERIVDIILEAYASTSDRAEMLDPAGGHELTRRETDVLVLVAKGLMSKEIAERLHISVHTVISHRKNITRKTNIKSVAGLALYALMNNLMEEGDAS